MGWNLIGNLKGSTGLQGPAGAGSYGVHILQHIPSSEHPAIFAGTSNYKCDTAYANAVASLPAKGGRIGIGFGTFKFDNTIHLKKYVHLVGDGTGHRVAGATNFLFPLNIPGMVIHTAITGPGGVEPAGGSGEGSIIEGITFAPLTAGGNVDGIWLRGRATLIQSRSSGWTNGYGVKIAASSTAGAPPFDVGNANNWQIFGGSFTNNKTGIRADLADANAGIALGVDVSHNTRYGVEDSSALGNMWWASHAEANGLGPYMTDSLTARALFLGFYTEGGQPGATVLHPSQVIGGVQYAGFVGDGVNKFALRLVEDQLIGIMSTSVTVNPVSLAPGTRTAAATAPATGNLGQYVLTNFDKDMQGVQLHAYFSAVNTVTYYFENPANNPAGTVDLPSGVARFSRMAP